MQVGRLFTRLQLILMCSFAPGWAVAGSLLDYLRDYDLNDYAFGIALSSGQNPYVGADSSTFAYPILTSFRDSTFTDDWLLLRDSDVGVRWVSAAGWELSGVARVQTLGFADSDSDQLLGVADRKWTVEAGPGIGFRAWPVHFYFKTYAEIGSRHDGLISQFDVSLPMEWSRGYFVPSIEASYLNDDYTDYYYAVTAAEATLLRPEYRAGAATNLALKARWGYAINQKWLLAGSVGFEQLDSAIANSPIVARDGVWSAGLSLAYNADVFQPREYDYSAPKVPKFTLKLGAFQDSASSKVIKDASNGEPGFEVDIEDILGAADESTVLQLDAIVRFGDYHRLEFGYFGFGRNSTKTLENDITIGDELFAAGTRLNTQVDTNIYHLGYGYSLMRDMQKELGIMAGIHFADFEANFLAETTGQTERSSLGTPLPFIGVQGAVFLSERTTLSAKIQIFRTDFDRYEGSLNYATLDLQYRLGDSASVGLGYNFYGLKLTSKESGVNGSLQVRHSGPVAFFTIGY